MLSKTVKSTEPSPRTDEGKAPTTDWHKPDWSMHRKHAEELHEFYDRIQKLKTQVEETKEDIYNGRKLAESELRAGEHQGN